MRTLSSVMTATIHEIVIEKSRFICSLFPVNSVEEINFHLKQIREQHNKASHNCYAYILGAGSEIQKCSDDGEPGGTAGMPMLNILRYENLSNILAIVTRYFGGIKLGTGGLTRAYGNAVKEALQHGSIQTKQEKLSLSITVSYSENEQIKYLLQHHGALIHDIGYGEEVRLDFYLAEEHLAEITALLTQTLARNINFGQAEKIFVANNNIK